jgi:hypothetical protein
VAAKGQAQPILHIAKEGRYSQARNGAWRTVTTLHGLDDIRTRSMMPRKGAGNLRSDGRVAVYILTGSLRPALLGDA